ncbi:MAG TPA: hypothetical protein VNO50_18165 [Pyrinomonadaceae bacterium]|nr:hypothetical protein [Pyrinomonadaceae bacterium]
MNPALKTATINTGRLSAIDLVCSIMDSQLRPLDFALLSHLNDAPSLEALVRGASSARNLYPATGSYIDKERWVRSTQPGADLTAVSVSSSDDVAGTVERFLDRPLDVRCQMPVQQLVMRNALDGEVKLLTRFHHAAADGLSAAMWLSHQLRVARNKESAVPEVLPFQDLQLRSHSSAVKKSRFAYRRPSDRLWTRTTEPTRTRRWFTIELPAAELREGCRTRGFTYNDLLTTCALEVFRRWNRLHSGGRRQNIGLWLPVNIRQHSAAGFGNGTSRIRLYARYNEGATLAEKCKVIRRQIFWSNRHGEWAVPQTIPLASLPRWAVTPLLRCYLNRPGVDMASGVFSHAERWTNETSEIFQHVEKLESIGQLHLGYCVAINGATHGDRTWLTFTYDPALLSSSDIEQMVELYQEQLAQARREFA